jgi:deoxyribodipyrimidine photo-lyase
VDELTTDRPSPELAEGGERVGLAHLKAWAAAHLEVYDEHHDDLAGDRTSRISAHLHLGTLSPLEVATRLRDRPGGAAFVRQLCWRDFYHQVLAARPEATRVDYRGRGDEWRHDPDELDAWREGRTGFPLVDAGMRQLRREGFMHNRARMVVASFLTKDLYHDWRVGAAHFMSLLIDGDAANNQLNWQWTAGTGTDSNPNRIFNPTVQSTRFDPDGTYIRRYVEELADVPAPQVHDPDATLRERCGYPAPIVDHREAIAAYRAAQEALRA